MRLVSHVVVVVAVDPFAPYFDPKFPFVATRNQLVYPLLKVVLRFWTCHDISTKGREEGREPKKIHPND